MRLLPALAMLAAAFVAAPASAQIDKGCYNYSGQNVWTAKSADKLRADIECFKKAKGLADISIANREKRIAQLAAVAPPVGDAVEPELGKNLDKRPDYVASNFDTAALVENGWPLAQKGTEDVGAFRFVCMAGDVKRDDPVVFPGQPGKSHLHQFFGNTGANAYSTYASLRSTGDSTCVNKLNRSAYWIPAMLDGTGMVVRPDYVVIYYKRYPATSKRCTELASGGCVDLPRGLRFIFGYDMVSGTPATGSAFFNCDGPTAKSGHYKTLAEVAPNCGPGNRVGMILTAPACWDGVHLDSANHRDHVGYASYWNNDGRLLCSANMKYVIPSFTLAAWYDVGPAGIGQPGSVATWSLSSDSMNMGGRMMQMPAGSTAHADWFGAWDEPTSDLWHANCINKLLSCNSGDLGDGRGMKQTWPFAWSAHPHLVPIPEAR